MQKSISQLSHLVTFFSVPKAFKGHIDIIQQNAIRSWLRLLPCENICLIGDDDGIAQIAQAYQIKHIGDLKVHELHRAPILSDIFQKAVDSCQTPYLCYINADIILCDDFITAAESVLACKQRLLMVSSRYNLDITQPITDMSAEACAELRRRALEKGDMYPAGGTDFFLAPKDFFSEVPPFLLGRGYWDNWLMYGAKQKGLALIDATADVVAIHQNHDYSHIGNIVADRHSSELVFQEEQGKYNYQLSGGKRTIFTNYDADYILKNNVLYSFWNLRYLKRPIKAILRRFLSLFF